MTGLPVAGAAFRPQGAPRVNRNKRQRTTAPIEAAEGGIEISRRQWRMKGDEGPMRHRVQGRSFLRPWTTIPNCGQPFW